MGRLTAEQKQQQQANEKRLYNLAKENGEDPFKWLAIYSIESSSGIRLKNGNAIGHFQIMRKFFADYKINEQGAYDLKTSFLAVRDHHAKSSAELERRLGHKLSPGEYYLGHQQGWGGATALLLNPEKNVVDVLSTKMSRSQALENIRKNGGRPDMTAQEYSNKWIHEMDRRYEMYKSREREFEQSNTQDKPSLPQQSKSQTTNEHYTTHFGLESVKNQSIRPEIDVTKVFQVFSDRFPKSDTKIDNENELNNSLDNSSSFDLK